MGKRKKVKRGKRGNIEKCPQPVMEIDRLPSPTSPNGEAGTNSDDEVSCPKNDYNITFTTRGENVICAIYWKVQSFYKLKSGVRYVCHLPFEEAKCCNIWELNIKKCLDFVYISLICYINDRNVTFSVLLGDKRLKTSPLLKVEATEQVNGTYSGELLYSTLERYEDEFRKEFFTLKCEVMLYVNDMTSSEYPHNMCFCYKLTDHFHELSLEKSFSDVTLKVGGNSFYCHACILAARSPAFYDFIFGNCSSQHQSLIPLFERPVITGDTFAQVLQYIYTGTTLPLSVDTAISVFFLSTALRMRNLRKKCSRFLKVKLSKENFLEIYSLAVLRNSRSLKIASKTFVVENSDMMESLNLDSGRNLIAPSFVTTEQFENVKSSLKELFESV